MTYRQSLFTHFDSSEINAEHERHKQKHTLDAKVENVSTEKNNKCK